MPRIEIKHGDCREVLAEMPAEPDCVLAYLAGVIDSDGTIGVKKNTCEPPTYSERIHIRQVQREAIDLLSTTFGGNIGTEDPHAKRGKSLFRWGLTDRKACQCLWKLLPYLRIKKSQAMNCLDLRELKRTSKIVRTAYGRGHMGSSRRSQELSDQMEACYQKAKELNKVGRS